MGMGVDAATLGDFVATGVITLIISGFLPRLRRTGNTFAAMGVHAVWAEVS